MTIEPQKRFVLKLRHLLHRVHPVVALVPKLNLGTRGTRADGAERAIWTLFLFIQFGALLNIALSPEFPIFPIISISLLALAASLLSRKLLLALFVVAVLTSGSLYLEVGPLIIRGFDFLLICTLLIVSFKWLIEPRSTFEFLPIFKVAFGLLILTALISMTDTLSLKKSMIELLQIIELLIAATLFFNLIKSESDIKFFFKVLLIYSVLDASWILMQYSTGQLQGRHIGWFQTLPFELSYGVAIATAFFHMAKKTLLKSITLLSIGLQTMAIYLSQGRGLLVTAILMATICNFIFAKRQKKIRYFVYGTLAISLAFLLSMAFLNPAIQSRYASIVEGGEMRDLRLVIWAVSLKIWQSFPWFGVGIGNAGIALAQFAPRPFGIALTALADVKTPHNEYLSWAVQGGWIGFIGGISFYGIFVRNAFANYIKKSVLWEYSVILFSFAAGLAIWNFANDTLLSGKGMFIMLLIALMARIKKLGMQDGPVYHYR